MTSSEASRDFAGAAVACVAAVRLLGSARCCIVCDGATGPGSCERISNRGFDGVRRELRGGLEAHLRAGEGLRLQWQDRRKFRGD